MRDVWNVLALIAVVVLLAGFAGCQATGKGIQSPGSAVSTTAVQSGKVRTCTPSPASHDSRPVSVHYSLGYPAACDLVHSNTRATVDWNKDGKINSKDACAYRDYPSNACSPDGRTAIAYQCSPKSLPIHKRITCARGCRDGACW